jgi:Mg/Co/Ni transporter MgtE
MSPRAAWRLESLGVRDVGDYTAGKADWLAAGLPVEGETKPFARVADAIDADARTCLPTEQVADVLQRVTSTGPQMRIVVVVNEGGIVQGLLRLDRITDARQALVEDVMEPGPVTVRADADLAATTERMRRKGVSSLLVTTPDGELLGVLWAPDRAPTS